MKFSLDKTLVGHQRWVWDCGFSADSAYLVSGKRKFEEREKRDEIEIERVGGREPIFFVI